MSSNPTTAQPLPQALINEHLQDQITGIKWVLLAVLSTVGALALWRIEVDIRRQRVMPAHPKPNKSKRS